MAIDLPESLQALARATVRAVFENNLTRPDLKPLHDWFEDVGWDEVVMSIQGGCASLENISERFFYDEMLEENPNSDTNESKITDEMRLLFARERIDFWLSQAEDSVHAVELKVSGLPSVFLDCYISGQGQGGWEVGWGSEYKTVQDLLDSYVGVVIGDSGSVSDKQILELWNANE
jgi:hypothetical protein